MNYYFCILSVLISSYIIVNVMIYSQSLQNIHPNKLITHLVSESIK